MGYPLATLTLAPWLFLQGRRVRQNTPQLSEAVGERSGSLGRGPDLKLLLLGDSAAAGVGVDHQSQALSGKLTDQLQHDYRLTWRVIAKAGRKLSHLLRHVELAEADGYDIVVISIGVNDVTAGTSPKLWRQQLQQLFDLIKARFLPKQIILSMIPPMHRFPALPQPLRWYMGLRARRLNNASQTLLATNTSCHFLTIDLPLTPDFMATDGFHPNEAANQLWANSIVAAINTSTALRSNPPTRIAAGAVFVREGRVLLGHRSPNLSYYPDVWDLIGGHINAGETPEQAMRREVEEEIGCTPINYYFLMSAQEPNPEQNGPAEIHIFVVTHWTGGEPQAKNHEHDQLGWFTLAEIQQLRLADPIYTQVLKKIDSLTIED